MLHYREEDTNMAKTEKKPLNTNYKAGDTKWLACYHYFGSTEPTKKEKSRKLFRVVVFKCAEYLELSNAEQILALTIPKAFAQEAEAAGWTLVEAVSYARDFYDSQAPSIKKPAPKKDVDSQAKQLAGILASLTDHVSPSTLLFQLTKLVETKGQAAVAMLEEMERENGRDPKGYIYLKKVTPKGSAPTDPAE
jgi:hypothetical protein